MLLSYRRQAYDLHPLAHLDLHLRGAPHRDCGTRDQDAGESGERRMSLFERTRHQHKPRNINATHKAEQGINTRIAVTLTRIVGSMQTAYVFAVLALVGLFAILGWLNPIVVLLVAWLSQTFLQLVFLPILSVGQNVLGRHAELMAEEQFATTQKMYADTELMIRQNNELIALHKAINEKLDKLAIIEAQSNDIFAQNDRILDHVQKPKPIASKVKTGRVVHSEGEA